MNARDVELQQFHVNEGKVAKANHPFWMIYKLRPVYSIDDPNGAVATARKPYRINVIIVQKELKSVKPSGIVACEPLLGMAYIRSHHNVKPLLFQ